eukprot:1034887-Pyramimonas_sp.AAC.1
MTMKEEAAEEEEEEEEEQQTCHDPIATNESAHAYTRAQIGSRGTGPPISDDLLRRARARQCSCAM